MDQAGRRGPVRTALGPPTPPTTTSRLNSLRTVSWCSGLGTARSLLQALVAHRPSQHLHQCCV